MRQFRIRINMETAVHWQIIKPVIPALLLINMHGVFGCAKKKVLDKRSTTEAAHMADTSKTDPLVKGKETAFTGFPEWCANQAQTDGSVCIKCERTTDSKEKASLATMCFRPRADFDPKILCGLSNIGLGIKTLSCHGAEKDVTADVSLPVDKAATVLGVVLKSLKGALQDTYKGDANSLATASAVMTFALDHMKGVLTNQDQPKTASDLVTLVNPFLVTSYPEGADKTALIAQLTTKLTAVHDAFAGTGTFSAKVALTVVLDIANVFPKERLGKAADVLTGPGIAKLLQSRKSELDPEIATWSENKVGVSSSDDLISQITGS